MRHLKFVEKLRNMGYLSCKADHDLWMRDRGDNWECVAVMVDDLLFFIRYPNMIIDTLKKMHQHELKGVGVTEYCRRSELEYDTNREYWTISSKTYTKTVRSKIENYLISE